MHLARASALLAGLAATACEAADEETSAPASACELVELSADVCDASPCFVTRVADLRCKDPFAQGLAVTQGGEFYGTFQQDLKEWGLVMSPGSSATSLGGWGAWPVDRAPTPSFLIEDEAGLSYLGYGLEAPVPLADAPTPDSGDLHIAEEREGKLVTAMVTRRADDTFPLAVSQDTLKSGWQFVEPHDQFGNPFGIGRDASGALFVAEYVSIADGLASLDISALAEPGVPLWSLPHDAPDYPTIGLAFLGQGRIAASLAGADLARVLVSTADGDPIDVRLQERLVTETEGCDYSSCSGHCVRSFAEPVALRLHQSGDSLLVVSIVRYKSYAHGLSPEPEDPSFCNVVDDSDDQAKSDLVVYRIDPDDPQPTELGRAHLPDFYVAEFAEHEDRVGLFGWTSLDTDSPAYSTFVELDLSSLEP